MHPASDAGWQGPEPGARGTAPAPRHRPSGAEAPCAPPSRRAQGTPRAARRRPCWSWSRRGTRPARPRADPRERPAAPGRRPAPARPTPPCTVPEARRTPESTRTGPRGAPHTPPTRATRPPARRPPASRPRSPALARTSPGGAGAGARSLRTAGCGGRSPPEAIWPRRPPAPRHLSWPLPPRCPLLSNAFAAPPAGE